MFNKEPPKKPDPEIDAVVQMMRIRNPSKLSGISQKILLGFTILAVFSFGLLVKFMWDFPIGCEPSWLHFVAVFFNKCAY